MGSLWLRWEYLQTQWTGHHGEAQDDSLPLSAWWGCVRLLAGRLRSGGGDTRRIRRSIVCALDRQMAALFDGAHHFRSPLF